MENFKEKDFVALLQDRIFNSDIIPNENLNLFKIQGKVIGSAESIVCISGLPKAYKSTLLASVIATSICEHQIFECQINLPQDKNKIAYFDTESSQYDFYKQVKRICNFAGVSKITDNIFCYSFREDSPYAIKRMIEEHLKANLDTSIIIIDGILDLLIDYNDIKESRLLINWLKKITKKYRILVITAIHLSKSNFSTTGTLGSNLDRYSQSVLLVENNGQGFTLSSKFMRSDINFNPINIINTGRGFEQIEAESKDEKITLPKHISNHSWVQILNSYLIEDEFNYKELCAAIVEGTGRGLNFAKKSVIHLKMEKIIFKTKKGYSRR